MRQREERANALYNLVEDSEKQESNELLPLTEFGEQIRRNDLLIKKTINI